MKDGGISLKKIVVTLGVFLAFVFCLSVSVPVYAQVTGATLSGIPVPSQTRPAR